jgi:hypothetical protein
MKHKKLLVFPIVFLGLLILTVSGLRAQTEVEQHKISIDSATGKRTVTTDTIIKTEQNISPYTDMININPLKFILAYNLSWVHKLSSNTAFGIGAEYEDFLNENPAWGILGEFRFYPSKKSLHGFYVAPNFSFTQTNNVYYFMYDPASGITNSGTFTAQMLTLGVLLGWQWFPADDFSMGFAIGADDYIPLNQKSGNNYEDFNLLGGMYGKGTLPTLRFDLGYAW